jgi:hypothetical protein
MSKNNCFESITRWLNNNFVPVVGAISSLVMLLLYISLEKHKFVINYYSLILFFSIFLFPATTYLEKIKIGSLELVRKQEIIEKRSIFGEVVTVDGSSFYYIYKNDERYELPNKETADFFSSNKGIITIQKDELNNFDHFGEIESVKSGKIVTVNKEHIFIILNGKLRHIGTASWLVKWKRSKECNTNITEDEANSNYGFW